MALVSVEERNRSLALYYGADKGSIASPSHDVAMFAGDPLAGGVELDSFGGYARVTITNDGTTWPDAPDGGAVSSMIVALPTSTDEWTVGGDPAVATHFLLFATDTGDAGDSGLLDSPISVAGAGEDRSVILTIFYPGTT